MYLDVARNVRPSGGEKTPIAREACLRTSLDLPSSHISHIFLRALWHADPRVAPPPPWN